MTRIHDFMVHGNFQETLKKMDDNTSQIIKAYKLEVTSHKI